MAKKKAKVSKKKVVMPVQVQKVESPSRKERRELEGEAKRLGYVDTRHATRDQLRNYIETQHPATK